MNSKTNLMKKGDTVDRTTTCQDNPTHESPPQTSRNEAEISRLATKLLFLYGLNNNRYTAGAISVGCVVNSGREISAEILKKCNCTIIVTTTYRFTVLST